MNIFKFFIYTVHNPRFNLFRLPDNFFFINDSRIFIIDTKTLNKVIYRRQI